jgi:hypothetical protein
VGAPPPELVVAAHAADTHHRSGDAIAGRLLSAAFALPLCGRKHRGTIRYDDIIRPDLRTGTDETLTKKIYRPFS